ncbi:MAG: mercuric reductase [Gemmatimonadetes bacterium]|nr:mercuric reductase [Gemmatimonadota bacterium]
MAPEQFDLIVIGAGQGGGPLAGAFARAGRRAALVERVHVGGTCVNEGCSPTKTMVASARVAHMARRAATYGVHTGELRVDLARVRERKQSIVDSFRTGSERQLAAAGVELIRATGRFTGPHVVAAAGPDVSRTLTAPIIVINAGQRPTIPALPGLDGVPYLTSTSIMELTAVPEHLVVLGGGYVGLEFGQMFRRFGSRVTIVHRSERLVDREDAEVADAVAEVLRGEGIGLVLGAAATRVSNATGQIVVAHRPTRASADAPSSTIAGSHLLVAVGRTPNTDTLGADAAGIRVDERGYIIVNERLETTAPGVYAIGDVKGGPAFTHISYDDFRILRTNLLHGGSATTTGQLVPYTMFIDPELGRIGMTEREARSAGKRVLVARLPMSSVARAVERDETQGFIKAVVDADSGHILGAAVLGIDGGEVAAQLQIAMMGGLHYSVLRDGVFSHPTLSESLNNLFGSLEPGRQGA